MVAFFFFVRVVGIVAGIERFPLCLGLLISSPKGEDFKADRLFGALRSQTYSRWRHV